MYFSGRDAAEGKTRKPHCVFIFQVITTFFNAIVESQLSVLTISEANYYKDSTKHQQAVVARDEDDDIPSYKRV